MNGNGNLPLIWGKSFYIASHTIWICSLAFYLISWNINEFNSFRVSYNKAQYIENIKRIKLLIKLDPKHSFLPTNQLYS